MEMALFKTKNRLEYIESVLLISMCEPAKWSGCVKCFILFIYDY